MRRLPTSLLIVLCTLLLAACGGEEAVTPPPAAAPTANPDPSAVTVACTDPSTGCTPGATQTGSGEQPPLPDGDADDLEGGLDGGSPNGNIFNPQAVFESDEASGGFEGGAFDDPYATGTSDGTDDAEDVPEEPVVTTYGPATVSVDSKNYSVRKNSIFPSDTQLFQISAIRAGAVDFELVAGEFGSGAQGFTLKTGQTQKLINDDEGIMYTVKLVRIDSSTTGGTNPTGIWRI